MQLLGSWAPNGSIWDLTPMDLGLAVVTYNLEQVALPPLLQHTYVAVNYRDLALAGVAQRVKHPCR